MTPLQFRASFPEFASTSDYPDALINFWLTLSVELVSVDRFGASYEHALGLLTAHNLVMARGNVLASSGGGVPGGASGAVASKSVGSVSVSYDNVGAAVVGSGQYGQTTYGRQYMQLVRLFGQGCYQI